MAVIKHEWRHDVHKHFDKIKQKLLELEPGQHLYMPLATAGILIIFPIKKCIKHKLNKDVIYNTA